MDAPKQIVSRDNELERELGCIFWLRAVMFSIVVMIG